MNSTESKVNQMFELTFNQDESDLEKRKMVSWTRVFEIRSIFPVQMELQGSCNLISV